MTTRSVNDIPNGDRTALEHLLGGPLSPNQQVFIMAYNPAQPVNEVARSAARARLQQTFSKQSEYAAKRDIGADEADAAVNEAMNHVRPRGD